MRRRSWRERARPTMSQRAGTITYAETPQHPGKGGRKHRFADLYHERTNYQFIDRSWRWLVLSGTLILISLAALIFSGLNLGIDFKGGTQWTFTVAGKSANTDDVRPV